MECCKQCVLMLLLCFTLNCSLSRKSNSFFESVGSTAKQSSLVNATSEWRDCDISVRGWRTGGRSWRFLFPLPMKVLALIIHPFVQRIAGSNLALAATYEPWTSLSLAVACGAPA